jgi:Flagellin and related hook-associated proteins
MIINHNLGAMNALRNMNVNSSNASKAMEKLSSGLRINRAGDDAAGLAISEKMRGQIRGLDQASANAQDGISMVQTAEGALSETTSILQRMRELAVQSSTDTNTASDRSNIQQEVDQLAVEITRISNTTEFNTQKLLNGGITTSGIGESTFQIGANANQSLSINIKAMDAKSLGVSRDVTTATVATAGVQDVVSASVGLTTGVAIVSGESAGLTANATAVKGQWGAGAAGLTGLTKLETTDFSSKYNDYKLITTKSLGAGVDVSASIDNTAKTITLNFSSDVAALASTDDKINTALSNAGITDLLATGDVTAVVPDAGAVIGTAGLASDEVKLTLTGSQTETAIVKNNAQSVTFSDAAKYAGLTLQLDGSLSASTAATINIGKTVASSASFSSGVKTGDALTAGGIDVSSQTAANSAITTVQNAINTVSSERSKLGAYQNRLEHTIANLGTSSENLSSAESRIRDVDMAKVMSEFSKNNILSQAAQAMLAQANQQPQQVLQLLR